MILRNIVLIVTAFLIIGCTSKAPVTNRSQAIWIPVSQELALGEKSYKQTLAKSKVIKNTPASKRVQRIGQQIAKAVNNDYKWEFNLIDNKAKNAFCLPGGKVVVYTGILEVAKNDDQLATVISHEIAHALARHGAERMTTALGLSGLQLIGNIALGSSGYSTAFNVAYGLGSQYGVQLPYGRMQENEADEVGIHLMHEAGYNIHESLNFWKNMSKGSSKIPEFLSTHPSSSTRIKNIKRVIKDIEKKNIISRNLGEKLH